jgi:hypothetical protein
MINKMEQIQNIMPVNGEILVRTEGKNQWFVHYFVVKNECVRESIYKTYTENPEKELDKVLEIIANVDHEVILYENNDNEI